ncbi:hypothetical protein NLI96_g12134 [Meripilus lineatus]|uniref:Uncharacterized protein n=1 Tax=Meripilus lineatus TaxID=2056292 RepID=A0AAD5UQK2_9APHY|nr:hypothetical protein NLI96_g12134 [Physisporinus lineatus]
MASASDSPSPARVSAPKTTQQRSGSIEVKVLRQYPIVQGSITELKDSSRLKWGKIVDQDCCLSQDDQVMFCMPLSALLEIAPWTVLVQLAKGHGLRLGRKRSIEIITEAFGAHTCVPTCNRLCVVLEGANPNLFRITQPHPARDEALSIAAATQTVFHSQGTQSTQMTLIFDEHSQADGVGTPASSVASNSNDDVEMVDPRPINDPSPSFPPKVLPISKRIDIIRDWTKHTATKIEEDICACCAQRVRRYTITRVPVNSKLLLPLADPHRPLRTSAKDHIILCSQGIENGQAKLCDLCRRNLDRKNMPQIALANGLSLGEVPPELKKLSFVEKLVVSKYRHYVSVIRVAKSGQRKLAGNAIVFAQPVPKFYNILPPPRKDLDDCLSVLFTGASKPTYEDFKRTPLLICRRVVQEALLWLMKNHPGYANVKFSQKNLDTYAEDSPPVKVVFCPQQPETGNIPTENLPVFTTTSEGGTEDGECSFAVSGLTGEELNNMTDAEKKLFALKALNLSEPFVAYGRSDEPESIFNNPNLFATNEYFPFIVFNHDQISAAVRGGWLVTEKRLFDDVVERILNLDPDTLDALIKRGQEDGYVATQNEDEKKVCRILPLIEHASANVDGSITQRKYQQHEIRSMIYEKGLPLFFITFSPVDFKNPICLHYCGRDISIAPLGPASEAYGDRLRTIASNPKRRWPVWSNLWVLWRSGIPRSPHSAPSSAALDRELGFSADDKGQSLGETRRLHERTG